MNLKLVLGLLVVALATMGFDCVNDNALISVNIPGLTGTFAINPGGTTFDETITVTASEYLNVGFSDINLNSLRVYDIRISTIGTFAGNVNGQVRINGQLLLSYNGPWNSFNTPQSLVTSSLLTRNAAGVVALLSAIRDRRDVSIRGVGNVSQAVPSGLSVRVEILAQADAAL